jgi:hypothetical protein
MKRRGLRNWLMLNELLFSGPAKILLSKLVHRRLFRHGAQRLGALLLQTCRSLLKTLIYQWLLLPLKTLKTQSSRRAQGKGWLLMLKTLKTQSSRRARGKGCLFLLVKTKSSITTLSLGHLLLLLKSQSSKTSWGKDRLLLLHKTKSSRTPRGKVHLLLLLKTMSPRAPWGKCHLLLLLQSNQSSYLALMERLLSHFLLHSSRFMWLLRIVCLVAFIFPSRKFRISIRTLVDKCFKHLNHLERRFWWMNPARILWPPCQNVLEVMKISTQGTIEGSIYSRYDHRGILENGDKDHNEFEYGKPLVTKQAHTKLSWPMRRLHEWYYLACVWGLQFIEGRVPKKVFKSQRFNLNIELFKLHTIYRLRILDVTMMTVFYT